MSFKRRLSGYFFGAGLALSMAAFVPAAFAQGGAAGEFGGVTVNHSADGSPPGGPIGARKPVASHPTANVNAPGAPANAFTAPGTGGDMGWGNGSGGGNAVVGAGHPVGFGSHSGANSASAAIRGNSVQNSSGNMRSGSARSGNSANSATTGWGQASTSGNAAYP